jgi:hypothetical protein
MFRKKIVLVVTLDKYSTTNCLDGCVVIVGVFQLDKSPLWNRFVVRPISSCPLAMLEVSCNKQS